jgi:hypothetical protein
MRAKGTVRARREDHLELIKSKRFRVATTLADELQFEHDFGATPPALSTRQPQPKEKSNGRTNND